MVSFTATVSPDEFVKQGLPLLMAYLECSPELQQHAIKLIQTITATETDDEDREFACITLADVLFPNTHEGDQKLGLDMSDVERLARQHPDTNGVLDEMDKEESVFSDRLLQAMESKGMTQAELAEKIGIGQPAISMMLSRDCRPQKRTLIKLADALGITPTDLWPE
jgi:lambda repressor-like predicted transcriptional regulator